ncbi:hypothetical protein SAMN04488077_13212 [Roseovarius tolerans]|uniref:Uncharacterized protein n=1 Tax=Roseovarius tolerans TaxID=74031 RepID=A0A1H8JKM5_9RHOB|nr:hypothetical protein [Roseovarius tolerans]SEN81081.1 hypothetical protein SAMN04488077_13212 [Roseovarius tolerans]
MSAAPDDRAEPHEGKGRRGPSLTNVMRVVLVSFIALFIAYWIFFERYLSRSIIVDAQTGALKVVLEAELSGKAFRDLWYCERIGDNERAKAVPSSAAGCPSRTHHWVGPDPLATPILPAGTELEITSFPNALRIDITSLPERFAGSDIGRLEAGALLLESRAALDALGTLPLSGKVEIGARFSETDRLSIVNGSYQVRGYSLTGLARGEMRQLRGGALLAGARVRFVEPDGETATGHVAVMFPDPESALMRVTAMSDRIRRPDNSEWEPVNNNLGIRYYFTREVLIRPSFLESLILDPMLQLLAMVFGAIAGYGWLERLLTVRSKKTSL